MNSNSIFYHVGRCFNCRQGILDIVQDIKYKNFFLICDDCDAEWPSPDRITKNDQLDTDRDCGEIKNASWEEIVSLGWDKYVQGNYVDFDCV